MFETWDDMDGVDGHITLAVRTTTIICVSLKVV